MIDFVSDELKNITDTVLNSHLHNRCGVERERKADGEIVSRLDTELERALRRFLEDRLPGTRIIGEESADAAAAAGVGLGEDEIWLIDPLDGTGNFLAGGDDFAVMLCRLQRGEPVASWIYLPARQVVAMAEAGSGAFLAGERMSSVGGGRTVEDMAGEVHAGFLPEGLKTRIIQAQARQPRRAPRFCAGATYVGMAQGEADYALYYRTRPWDHAPGTLFIREAGGRAARFDGTPYRPGDGASGLLVTAAAEDWDGLREFLLEPPAPSRPSPG